MQDFSFKRHTVYLENRFIYNKLEAILFEEMRRIDLLWEIVKYTAICFECLMYTNVVALTVFLFNEALSFINYRLI
jgi:hypothetical protein